MWVGGSSDWCFYRGVVTVVDISYGITFELDYGCYMGFSNGFYYALNDRNIVNLLLDESLE